MNNLKLQQVCGRQQKRIARKRSLKIVFVAFKIHNDKNVDIARKLNRKKKNRPENFRAVFVQLDI